MKLIFPSIFLLFAVISYANITDYLKAGFGKAAKNQSIEGIDAIYVINLDQRPEKFQKITDQFLAYGIQPYRFSAIYGWDLSKVALYEVGMEYQKDMVMGKWASTYSSKKDGAYRELLDQNCSGKRFVSTSVSPGAIGRFLSHLSILQNAYKQGYKTIWVLEDNVSLQDDPHQLSSYIKKLDKIVGEKWDVLSTGIQHPKRDEELFAIEHIWRPDIPLPNQEQLFKQINLNKDFVKIGHGIRPHSVIYRRSGIKKILDFEKKHSLFNTYENELSLIPNIKMFALKHNLTPANPGISDVQTNYFGEKVLWTKHQQTILSQISEIMDRKNFPIAAKMMEFIHDHNPQTVVEIGSLDQSIPLCIAETLKYQKQGVLYSLLIEKGARSRKQEITKTQNFLDALDLKEHYQPFSSTEEFENGSIDILVLDHPSSPTGCLEEVRAFLPKVKPGGHIFFMHACKAPKHQAILHLLEHCTWMKEVSIGCECVLFQKQMNQKQAS